MVSTKLLLTAASISSLFSSAVAASAANASVPAAAAAAVSTVDEIITRTRVVIDYTTTCLTVTSCSNNGCDVLTRNAQVPVTKVVTETCACEADDPPPTVTITTEIPCSTSAPPALVLNPKVILANNSVPIVTPAPALPANTTTPDDDTTSTITEIAIVTLPPVPTETVPVEQTNDAWKLTAGVSLMVAVGVALMA